jgi:hypothetical protein
LQERFTAKLSGNFLEFSNKCSKLPGAINPAIIFPEIKIRKSLAKINNYHIIAFINVTISRLYACETYANPKNTVENYVLL